jgi:hypothetical protein
VRAQWLTAVVCAVFHMFPPQYSEARRAGVPLVMNPHHPARSVEALRLILSAPGPKRQSVAEALFRWVILCPYASIAFVCAVMHQLKYSAYWVEGVNIADPAQLGKIAAAVGVTATDAAKDELAKNTDEAVAAGAFGVPSFVVSSPEPRLYYGQDRVNFVATAAGVRGHLLSSPLRLTADASPSVVRTIKCYFDFSSPWAYLGVMQASDMCVFVSHPHHFDVVVLCCCSDGRLCCHTRRQC